MSGLVPWCLLQVLCNCLEVAIWWIACRGLGDRNWCRLERYGTFCLGLVPLSILLVHWASVTPSVPSPILPPNFSVIRITHNSVLSSNVCWTYQRCSAELPCYAMQYVRKLIVMLLGTCVLPGKGNNNLHVGWSRNSLLEFRKIRNLTNIFGIPRIWRHFV